MGRKAVGIGCLMLWSTLALAGPKTPIEAFEALRGKATPTAKRPAKVTVGLCGPGTRRIYPTADPLTQRALQRMRQDAGLNPRRIAAGLDICKPPGAGAHTLLPRRLVPATAKAPVLLPAKLKAPRPEKASRGWIGRLVANLFGSLW